LFFRLESLKVAKRLRFSGRGKTRIAENSMKRKQKEPAARKLIPGIVDDCPCTQTRCHRHGNCVECIRVHRTRQQHIPECLQGMFRGLVKDLAALVEFDVRDLRRTPAFWDERLGKEAPPPSRRQGGVPVKKPSGKQSVAKRK
jgi:hypothetical protein